MEVFKGVGEAAEAAFFKEGAEAEFDAGGDEERVLAVMLGSDGVGVAIFLYQSGDFGVRELVHAIGKVSDAVSRDGVAEDALGFDLIAFGDGDVAQCYRRSGRSSCFAIHASRARRATRR